MAPEGVEEVYGDMDTMDNSLQFNSGVDEARDVRYNGSFFIHNWQFL